MLRSRTHWCDSDENSDLCLNFFQDRRPCAWFCGATGGRTFWRVTVDAISLWQFNVTIRDNSVIRQKRQIQPQKTKTTALRCSLGLLYHQCWVFGAAAFVICHEIHLIESCFFFAVWRRLKHECFVQLGLSSPNDL